ncbi:MAG TPA: preprotein translocase subunit SecE [Rhodothermales bacterium]|nr:preprotein translocase subunit SecE [Rhodothermales bacterium]
MANKAVEYAQEVNKEMRKVSWPSRQELIANTAITLVASLLFSLLIFGIDEVISRVLQLIYGA